MWKNVNRCGTSTAIYHFDANADVFRVTFGIFDKNIEVVVIVENPGIQQFILRLILSAPRRFSSIRSRKELSLWILVEIFEI